MHYGGFLSFDSIFVQVTFSFALQSLDLVRTCLRMARYSLIFKNYYTEKSSNSQEQTHNLIHKTHLGFYSFLTDIRCNLVVWNGVIHDVCQKQAQKSYFKHTHTHRAKWHLIFSHSLHSVVVCILGGIIKWSFSNRWSILLTVAQL